MKKLFILLAICILLGWSTNAKAQAFTFVPGQLSIPKTLMEWVQQERHT
jgi:hypothetical protein